MYISNQFTNSVYQPNFKGCKFSLSKIQSDILAGYKMNEIAERNNVSVRTLYYIIAQFKLYPKKELKDRKVREAITLIKKAQLSQKEISERTGLSRYMVSKIITQYFSISPYQQRIELLKEMLRKPLSNKEIAEQLNESIDRVKMLRQRFKIGNRESKKIECLKQILKLKEAGESNTAVAKKLNISKDTVIRLLKAYKNNEISILN